MVSWWKRLTYSLIGTVVGAGVSGACAAAQQVIANSHNHLSAMGIWTAVLFFDPWVIALSFPGWVLALPLVLLVTNVRGWRFWMYFAIGLGLGPALVLIVALYYGPGFAGLPGSSMSAVYLAGSVSGLATLIYLLLLRRGQARAVLQASEAVV